MPMYCQLGRRRTQRSSHSENVPRFVTPGPQLSEWGVDIIDTVTHIELQHDRSVYRRTEW